MRGRCKFCSSGTGLDVNSQEAGDRSRETRLQHQRLFASSPLTEITAMALKQLCSAHPNPSHVSWLPESSFKCKSEHIIPLPKTARVTSRKNSSSHILSPHATRSLRRVLGNPESTARTGNTSSSASHSFLRPVLPAHEAPRSPEPNTDSAGIRFLLTHCFLCTHSSSSGQLRSRPSVSVFTSASQPPKHPIYLLACESLEGRGWDFWLCNQSTEHSPWHIRDSYNKYLSKESSKLSAS